MYLGTHTKLHTRLSSSKACSRLTLVLLSLLKERKYWQGADRRGGLAYNFFYPHGCKNLLALFFWPQKQTGENCCCLCDEISAIYRHFVKIYK